MDQPGVVGDPGVQGGEADGGEEQRPAEQRHRGLGRFAAVPQVLGHDRRGEGDQRDPHQQVEVEQEELAVDHPHLIEEPVVVEPDHPDLGERQQVGEVARPLVPQRAGQGLSLLDLGWPQFDGQQRDHDRQDAVGERLEPGLGHPRQVARGTAHGGRGHVTSILRPSGPERKQRSGLCSTR
jgi:hypothetical protein